MTFFQRRNTDAEAYGYIRCTVSLIIREMRIRIIVRYYLTLIRMATIKRTTEQFWKVYGENKTFSALLVGMKFGAAITENRTQILQKKSSYPKETKTKK